MTLKFVSEPLFVLENQLVHLVEVNMFGGEHKIHYFSPVCRKSLVQVGRSYLMPWVMLITLLTQCKSLLTPAALRRVVVKKIFWSLIQFVCTPNIHLQQRESVWIPHQNPSASASASAIALMNILGRDKLSGKGSIEQNLGFKGQNFPFSQQREQKG